MAHHAFTKDQNTMEWYVDGIPVAELKRRYEAHDALVEALRKMIDQHNNGVVGISFICLKQAERALAAAEVRNG